MSITRMASIHLPIADRKKKKKKGMSGEEKMYERHAKRIAAILSSRFSV